MSTSEDASRDYRALRQSATSVQLATINPDDLPEASYAPCVWLEGDCFLFLSALSSHTGNLRHNPRISLLLLDHGEAANAFARKRASLQGSARIIDRDDDIFTRVMREFHRNFGKVMQIIEPLPDFVLFRVSLEAGSFVRGFGQAYRLEGEGLMQLVPLDPRG